MRKLFLLILLLMYGMMLTAEIREIETGESSLKFKLKFKAELTTGDIYSYLIIDENDVWTLPSDPGVPQLPYRKLMVAVPPEGDFKVTFRVTDREAIKLAKPILPVETIIPDGKTSDFIYVQDREKYLNSRIETVVKGDRFFYNGYSLIPLNIHPCGYEYRSGILELKNEIEIEIEFVGNTNYQGEIDREGEWLDEDMILNYHQARRWRDSIRFSQQGINWASTQFWYKLRIDEAGVYELTGENLEVLPQWSGPEILRLFSVVRQTEGFIAKEVPIFISGGEAVFAYEGKNKVLWLAAGGEFETPPLRGREPLGERKAIEEIIAYQPELSDRGRNIECVMIRPEGYFEEAAEILTELHDVLFGVVSATVVQEDIFDIESGGQADPMAIRTYLMKYLEENPSLDYVVLLGSGSTDFENSSAKNKIITWKYGIDTYSTDDNFVYFNQFECPELVIGRIPAQTESMMDEYIERVQSYYNDQEPGWWQNRLLLIADDENKGGGLEGIGYDHPMNHTNKMEETLSVLSYRQFIKVYGLEYPFDSFKNKPGAVEDIISALREGCLVTYYIGHGSSTGLGDEDYFTNEMVPLLDNDEHLTLFMAGSCNVGHYDDLSTNCLAELLLFGEGGAIASIAATEGSTPAANSRLLKSCLEQIYSRYGSIGKALKYAKWNSGAAYGNSKKYNILGDPVLHLPVPLFSGTLNGITDSLQYRQTVGFQGDFVNKRINGEGETQVLDSEQQIHYINFIQPDTSQVYEVDYYRSGNTIFRGNVFLTGGEYESSFIVPDNAGTGNRGMILTITSDIDGSYLNGADSVMFVDSSLPVQNEGPPEVKLYLDSKNFRSGDTVSESPLLIADIADSSGINLTENTGRNIMVLMDESDDPEDLIDVGAGFIYDKGSHTKGTLIWQLPVLSKGMHDLKLIVYDNFGLATVSSVEFKVNESGKIAITQVLPYPHPMAGEGYFTFILTSSARVNLSIFTITGKKIKTLHSNCETGYNQLYWDGRDEDGDKPANNTYFYRIEAIDPDSGKSSEVIEKLIILK